MSMVKTSADLFDLQEKTLQKQDKKELSVKVCDGTGCRALGSQKVLAKLKEEISAAGMAIPVEIYGTGCPGFCEYGPLLTIYPQQISYQKVKVEDVPEIVSETLVSGKILEHLLFKDPQSGARIQHEPALPFYQKQERLVLELNGQIDPTSLDDYLARGGYRALGEVLSEKTPEEVISEIKKAGLRGRGGAGFPTGKKWEICRENVLKNGDDGYIICNADEGDPGAFMDRSILEGNPHQILEGMLIGAYAIGCSKGYIYLRAEYPLAIENMQIALQQAAEKGLLGENILGTGFDFEIKIRLGAGAFVCGEETSLMASIEGRTGEPRPRPPYPAQKGLWGKPTNINNVETWANVPVILRKGAEVYASLGTETSKGTKIFSLVGKINNTGLVEVPMGITLREIIFDIGGGIPNGKAFKAVQLGGPSGGCIPAEYLDTPIDYESLNELGAIMGSGGMVVADEDTCMVDFARYFMRFAQEESCGKCVPCRVGTKAMLETLERICRGEGRPRDIDYLLELGAHIKQASLCGLGQTAPNPVLSTLRYFREEYEAHILDKKCPAKSCKDLISYQVVVENCTGCHACVRACPAAAIQGEVKGIHQINPDECIRCGMCLSVCRFEAIEVV